MKNISLYEYLENEPLKEHITLNQVVYVIPDGNRARKVKNPYEIVEEWEITKIGRKYFYAKNSKDYVKLFEIYCGYIKDKSEYGADYRVFLNKADYLFEYACWMMDKRDLQRYKECLDNL